MLQVKVLLILLKQAVTVVWLYRAVRLVVVNQVVTGDAGIASNYMSIIYQIEHAQIISKRGISIYRMD